MAGGVEHRSQRTKAVTERARSYFNENLPTLAANAGLAPRPPNHLGIQPSATAAPEVGRAGPKKAAKAPEPDVHEDPTAPTAVSKRIITRTEKGAEELATRTAQREQHEKYEQRAKRKAEAEARGNASQPSPLPAEMKCRKIVLEKPGDILAIPYSYLTNEKGRIKWLRQALIRRDGVDPYEEGMESEELMEIYREVPNVSDVRWSPPTDVTIGKTVVKKPGNPAAPLRATDHTTIGLGGAPNYFKSASDPRGSSAFAPASSPAASCTPVFAPRLVASPRSACGTPPTRVNQDRPIRPLPKSSLVASGTNPRPSGVHPPSKSTATSNAAGSNHVDPAQSAARHPSRQAACQPPTPQSQPRRQASSASALLQQVQDLSLDEDHESSEEPLAVAGGGGCTGATPTKSKRQTKRSEAQLHRFGAARPLVAKLCERIRVRFATICPFADMVTTSELDDTDDLDKVGDPHILDPPRALLDDWLNKEWPRVNQIKRPGLVMLPFEDRYRRYIRAQFCRWRCDAKALISPRITYEYPFVRDVRCQQNVDLVKKLDPDRFHSPNLRRDQYRFQHGLIGTGIKGSYYSSRGSLGFKYKKNFKAMPSALIAYFCCIIRHCIREYATGEYVSESLNAQDLLEYWRMYNTVLEDMAQPGHEPNRLQRYQKKLFEKCHGPETREERTVIIPAIVQWHPDSESEEDDMDVDQDIKHCANKGKQRAQPSSPTPTSQSPAPLNTETSRAQDSDSDAE